jgi:hypothetical protein
MFGLSVIIRVWFVFVYYVSELSHVIYGFVGSLIFLRFGARQSQKHFFLL